MDPDRWEFANEGFLKGQKPLLKTISRRRTPPNPPYQLQYLGPSLEIGKYALDGEIDRLKRDKNILMAEVIKLRQEQQNTRARLQAMEERLQGTEQKQQQIMAFLARAMQNPNFLQQLAQQDQRRKELEDAITKKRRRPLDFRPNDIEEQFELEGQGLQDLYRYGGSALESLAIEILGLENNREGKEEHEEKKESGDPELNDEFWEELLNEGIGEKGEEDAEVLAKRLGGISSSSPK